MIGPVEDTPHWKWVEHAAASMARDQIRNSSLKMGESCKILPGSSFEILQIEGNRVLAKHSAEFDTGEDSCPDGTRFSISVQDMKKIIVEKESSYGEDGHSPTP